MKLIRPDITADQQPETQTRKGEPGRIIRPQDQAQAGLAADISGDRRVYLTAETAHRFTLRYRDQPIDRGHHAIPVADQVKSDDRRNDQK
jgi:hypothetical protein